MNKCQCFGSPLPHDHALLYLSNRHVRMCYTPRPLSMAYRWKVRISCEEACKWKMFPSNFDLRVQQIASGCSLVTVRLIDTWNWVNPQMKLNSWKPKQLKTMRHRLSGAEAERLIMWSVKVAFIMCCRVGQGECGWWGDSAWFLPSEIPAPPEPWPHARHHIHHPHPQPGLTHTHTDWGQYLINTKQTTFCFYAQVCLMGVI